MDGQIRPRIDRPPAPRAVLHKPRAGVIMNMTANRLILLLQVYRDGGEGEKRIGTFESDLRMLLLTGFIRITSGTIYEVTERGDAYVKKLLAVKP